MIMSGALIDKLAVFWEADEIPEKCMFGLQAGGLKN
jgi:hypothetical protein